jgi:probable HAF family extracellular repeat protein
MSARASLLLLPGYLTYVAEAAAPPALRGLGDLPGGEYFSEVSGISGDGSTIVGWSSSAASGAADRQAFRWRQRDGMIALPPLPGGPVRCNAGTASRNGAVIVGDAALGEGSQAVLWDAAGQIVPLGDLPGGQTIGTARGVSEDGQIIVGSSGSAPGWEAFRWTSAGGMIGMGDLAGGPFNSVAATVTNGGTVIFGTGNTLIGTNAVRWTPAGGLQSLGDLPGGGTFSEPYNATPDGAVAVGRAMSTASGSRFEAFRWSAATGMRGLGDLPGGVFESWALDVTDDGQTVVGFGTTAAGQEAMIWTTSQGMRRLADVLTTEHGVQLNGWRLTWACAISGDGGVITGNGVNPTGQNEAWVFTKPQQTAPRLP